MGTLLPTSAAAVARQVGEQVELWCVQPETWAPRRLAEFRTGTIDDLRWRPDSKALLFSYATASADVVLLTDFQ